MPKGQPNQLREGQGGSFSKGQIVKVKTKGQVKLNVLFIGRIAALNNNTTAGRDDVLVEQLKHIGQRPINGYIQCSTYASQETRSPRYRDTPRLSPYSSQGKTPRFRRTTDQSPSYAIRTNFTNE